MSEHKINLGFSPCPNDTFMFYALARGVIDTGNVEYTILMEDIEELNKRAGEGEIHISKISYAAYPLISENYLILNAGSALGFKNGPLIVSKQKVYPDELGQVSMAIPGEYTTANFLLENFYPGVQTKKAYLFSDIEEAVLSGETDAGLLIHESRFTFREKGLRLVDDLGERWEEAYSLPVPLGCVVGLRELGDEMLQEVESHIRESIRFAMENPSEPLEWIKKYSRELSDEVIRKHIELYVNRFSLHLGEEGRSAVGFLYNRGIEEKRFQMTDKNWFLENIKKA